MLVNFANGYDNALELALVTSNDRAEEIVKEIESAIDEGLVRSYKDVQELDIDYSDVMDHDLVEIEREIKRYLSYKILMNRYE